MVMAGIFDREEGRAQHGFPGLIGRGWESAKLDGLLRRFRLVTVVGMGGVGKSALAADAAERVGRTGTTVVAVDMAGLSGTEPVFQAVGRSSSQALLLVDNCDRLPAPRRPSAGCWRPVQGCGCWSPRDAGSARRARRCCRWHRCSSTTRSPC